MTPTRISLVTVGHMPPDLSLTNIRQWRSSAFELVGAAETYVLNRNSDGPDWEYSDAALEELLPTTFEGELLFAITNVPLVDNYYARRLSGNRIAVSLHEVADVLRAARIPVENAILRLLYSATLTYRRLKLALPPTEQIAQFMHDETRGCLFDMNGYKTDLKASCHHPIVCEECASQMRNQQVPLELIATVRHEIRKIRKPLYYRMVEWVQSHPVFALALSAGAAVALGIISSLIASLIYATLNSTKSTS